MAVYGNMVLTVQGMALYSKAQTGVQLNFSRMQIGSGKLAVGQDPTTLTALITPISNFAINSIKSSGNTSAVKGVFENSGIAAPTYSCELGLFAQDPDVGEILYAYANAGDQGDTIPPISSGPLSKQYQINAAIGNAANVTATIPADAYIPQSQIGAAGGVAPLDANSHVPIVNLPQIDHNNLLNKGVHTHAQIDAFIGSAGAASGLATLDAGGQIPVAELGNVPAVNAATSAARGSVRVSANPAAGDPVSPSRVATVSEVNLATVAETSIASYNPAAAGNFLVLVYLRVITAATTVTVKVTYADATGAQTTFIINAQAEPVGSYSLLPLFINAVAATLIDVRVTANTANQVKASASILGV